MEAINKEFAELKEKNDIIKFIRRLKILNSQLLQ